MADNFQKRLKVFLSFFLVFLGSDVSCFTFQCAIIYQTKLSSIGKTIQNVWRSAEWGKLSGFFFLILLMIIKLDFKRFNMLFLDSCQPSKFFLYNFLKIENLSRFQIKQLRKWTLNNRVLRASTRTKCVFNKTEVSHLFHTISLVPVMQSRSAM